MVENIDSYVAGLRHAREMIDEEIDRMLKWQRGKSLTPKQMEAWKNSTAPGAGRGECD